MKNYTFALKGDISFTITDNGHRVMVDWTGAINGLSFPVHEFRDMCQTFIGIDIQRERWLEAIDRATKPCPEWETVPNGGTITEMYLETSGPIHLGGIYTVSFYGTEEGTIVCVIVWADDNGVHNVVLERSGHDWYQREAI